MVIEYNRRDPECNRILEKKPRRDLSARLSVCPTPQVRCAYVRAWGLLLFRLRRRHEQALDVGGGHRLQTGAQVDDQRLAAWGDPDDVVAERVDVLDFGVELEDVKV